MILKHGAKQIPVKFMNQEKLHENGRDMLEEGQFLFGMYKAKDGEILINKECRGQFSTFVHELGEYILNEYQQETPHPEMSIYMKVLSEILEQNWNAIGKSFKLGRQYK